MARPFAAICSIAVLLSLYSNASTAQEFDIYAGAHGGLAMLEDAATTDTELPGVTIDFGFDNGFTAAGALGLIAGQYRSELELSYQKNDLDDFRAEGITVSAATAGVSGDTAALTGLVNVYYDFNMGGSFSPYLTGGFGLSNIDAEFTINGTPSLSESDKDTVFTYQLGAGLGYAVTENVTVDGRYRYLTSSDPDFQTTTSEFSSHNFMLGIRVKLN